VYRLESASIGAAASASVCSDPPVTSD
jgi:hypothetical protein